jgi:hypothetical protein
MSSALLLPLVRAFCGLGALGTEDAVPNTGGAKVDGVRTEGVFMVFI